MIDVTEVDDGSRTIVVTRQGEFPDAPNAEIGRHRIDIVQVSGQQLPLVEKDSSGEKVAAALDRINRRAGEDGDVTLIGRHLFDVLLGKHWQDLTAPLANGEPLLLGLRWPATDEVLSCLPWEAMHDGEWFLATRPQNVVATARFVAGSRAYSRTVEEVPRILFAVGSSLDDPEIRPGAELMGLLRDFERGRDDDNDIGWVETRTTASTSLSQLEESARSFRPNSVHIVAHGERRTEKPYEMGVLLDDEIQTAHQLALATRWQDDGGAERFPDLMVISACDSASAGLPVAGSSFSVPLAAQLVIEGIPIVVGMAGEVGDKACRLFTRRFGVGLLRGEDVATSAAHGRRAAYLGSGPPTSSIDWALPTVFVSDKVPLNHVAIPFPDKLRQIRQVAKKLEMVVGRGDPVFCGREEFFCALDDLVDRKSDTQVVVAWAQHLSGFGEKRLLKELGRRAIHRGYLPVDLEDNHGPAPTTTTALVVDIVRSIFVAAEALHLPVFSSTVLGQLGVPETHHSDWGMPIEQTAEARTRPEMNARSLGIWLAADFDTLITTARVCHPEVFPDTGSAILMMHRVHRMVNVLDSLLPERRLISSTGVGSDQNPVPVIMTASMSEDAGIKLNDAKNHGRNGWLYEELQSFRPNNELIVSYYLWVLMNPRPGKFKMPSGVYLGENVYTPLRSQDGWRKKMQERFDGVTGDFGWSLMDMAFSLSGDPKDEARQFDIGDDEKLFADYIKAEKR